MNRVSAFFFIAIAFVVGLLVGTYVVPAIDTAKEVIVYRTSSGNSNHYICVYSDITSSSKWAIIQPYEYPNDMKYIITVNNDYDSISVSAFKSEGSEWSEVSLIEMGEDQYAIEAIPVFYYSGYAHRTVTYCISITKGNEVNNKYYFTTREDK